MILNKITQATRYIQALNKKEFKKYLIITLTGIGGIALMAIYYTYHTNSSLTQEIKRLNTQTNKIAQLIARNKQLIAQEAKITDILEKNPDFDMNIYFESFMAKHKVKPESVPKPEEGDEIESARTGVKYQEITLKALFKNQTMEKLVTILQNVYKEQIIYLKHLEITKDKKNDQKKINFELTLATKQYKKEKEE